MQISLQGEHHGEEIDLPLPDGQVVTIGRGTGNDLVLPSQTVSREHATVRRDGSSIHVTDRGSLNGTRVNGQAVDGEGTAAIGDRVEFGSVVLLVSDGKQTRAPLFRAPVFQDESDVSQSILLSREDTRSRRLTAAEPGILEMLIEVGQLLVLPGEGEEGEDTFDRILELVEKQFPANRILLLLTENGGEPVQRAARVRGDRAISPLMLSRTMVRMVVDDGASVLTGDAQEDERFRHQQSIVAQDLRSAMAVPLTHAEEILGVLYVDTNDPIASYTEHDLRVLTLLGQMLGTKVANARLLEKAAEQQRLEEELRTADGIQRRLLPQTLPEITGYEIVGRQDTCEAVGGDLYDAGTLEDGRFQVVLADVSGKGIGAALLMSDILATIRALRSAAIGSAELVDKLHHHLLSTTQPEHYATLFLAEIDPGKGSVEFVNAGHPPAFVVTRDGATTPLERTGFPVGLIDDPIVKFEAGTAELPPGASLVIYSDGVSEAQRGEEQFGEEGRLERVLAECAGAAANECADKLLRAVDSYIGDTEATDDTTILIVHRDG